MLSFNSSNLRYKFIYLTKNVYDGIAINAIFEESLQASRLINDIGEGIPFHLIDKYIDFIPFSLRFIDIYSARSKKFEQDIILPAKWQDSKRIMLTNVLFFVDMYNPDQTSFLHISGDKSPKIVKEQMSVFLMHCAATINHDKKKQCKDFRFTLREQQMIFHLLEGMSIKDVSHALKVSDKAIYLLRNELSCKLGAQMQPYIYNRTRCNNHEECSRSM